MFVFLLNAKIIVQSYASIAFQKIISSVNYLKYLKINHGIRYFKKYATLYDFCHIKKSKVR